MLKKSRYKTFNPLINDYFILLFLLKAILRNRSSLLLLNILEDSKTIDLLGRYPVWNSSKYLFRLGVGILGTPVGRHKIPYAVHTFLYCVAMRRIPSYNYHVPVNTTTFFLLNPIISMWGCNLIYLNNYFKKCVFKMAKACKISNLNSWNCFFV